MQYNFEKSIIHLTEDQKKRNFEQENYQIPEVNSSLIKSKFNKNSIIYNAH